MTKEEAIDLLVNDYKNGNRLALSDYCNRTNCDECPFSGCSNDIFYMLADRLLKSEKHQETNFDHYYDSKLAFDKGETDDIYTLCFKPGTDEVYKKSGIYDFKKWLLSPYKEPKKKYKLSKFEYDLLKCYCEPLLKINDIWILAQMKSTGYFKGIPHNVSIWDILDNCEVTDECT